MSSKSPLHRASGAPDAPAARAVVRRPVVIPRRKPMRQARRVSLFEREIHVRLSPAAIEILFGAAAVLSEGLVEGSHFYGSTMITLDLAQADGHVSEPCDVSTARDVERLLGADPRIHEHARELGAAEADRLAGRALQPAQIDLRMRRSGCQFHVDMDVEAITEDAS
jgi:hypothetical protein